MNRPFYLVSAIFLALAPAFASGQFLPEAPSTADYLRLLKATKLVENYKEMAAVSARVFGARELGSDKEYARTMAVVATADLSDAEGCFLEVYRRQNFTRQDIVSIVSVFESPLGIKLLEQSQRKLIVDLEHGSIQPFPANAFTEDEKRELRALQQSAPFRKYSLMSASPAFAVSTGKCIMESQALKNAGINFWGK